MIITNQRGMTVNSQDVYVQLLRADGCQEIHTVLSNWLDLVPYPIPHAAVLLIANESVNGTFTPFSFTKRKEKGWLFKGIFARN